MGMQKKTSVVDKFLCGKTSVVFFLDGNLTHNSPHNFFKTTSRFKVE